jgi:hypothetical protein
MSYDEDYEDNNYDDYEPGNYNFYDLINDFEDLALKVLQEMLKQKGNHFVYNPDHGQWDEFLKQIKRQISNEKLEGMTDETLKALGLNTFACRILKTNRERRYWQWQTFGLSLSPEVILWQILDEIRPEVIDELYDEPLKKFIKLNALSEKYNHSNYVKRKLTEEKNTDEEKENYLKTISTLKEEFIESIKKWCKKHNFVNQNDKPLKWCL